MMWKAQTPLLHEVVGACRRGACALFITMKDFLPMIVFSIVDDVFSNMLRMSCSSPLSHSTSSRPSNRFFSIVVLPACLAPNMMMEE